MTSRQKHHTNEQMNTLYDKCFMFLNRFNNHYSGEDAWLLANAIYGNKFYVNKVIGMGQLILNDVRKTIKGRCVL